MRQKQMKVGVLGLGNMGKKILPAALFAPEVSTVLGYDIDQKRCAEAEEKYGILVHQSYETILADPDVALIFIATPNHTHCELSTLALAAGKSVLCEKPMATNLKDAERMVEVAEAIGGFLQVGFELRYSKLYLWVKERIDNGLIGDVVNTQCTYICSEFHGKGSWRNLKSEGGGMFGEKLSHYVDLPRWWINSPVVEVSSVCSPNVVPYYEVKDNYHTTCRYENGAVSHLTFMMGLATTLRHDPLQNHITMHSDDGHELRYLILGKGGAIETDVFRRRMRRWAFNDSAAGLVSRIVEEESWPDDMVEDNRYVHNTTDQTLDVIRRVAKGLPPYTSPRDALETMRVVFAAEQSAELAQPIALHEKALCC